MSNACRSFRIDRLIALAGTSLATTALAQSWSGLSGLDSNWTTGANWVGGVVPPNTGSANLTFTGSSRPSNTMNANWDVNSITFNNLAAAFTINGPLNTLTLRTGGLSSTSSNTQTLLNNTVVVAANQTWASSGGSLIINPSQVTLNAALSINPTGTGSITLNSFVNGTGLLNKLGTGTLLMGAGINPSTNSGLISIIQGSLRTTTTNAISDAASVSVSSGASLILGGVSETLFGLSGGTLSSVDLQASTLVISHDGSDTLTFPGIISGTGNLTKLGTYSQVLSGPNTYSGTTTVTAGTLRLAADERLADSSILTVNGSGVFELQGFTETVLAVNQTGGQIGPTGTTGTLSANAYNLESGSCRLRLTGPGGINKSNPALNYVLFSGNNTYAGSTNVSGGILVVNAIDALPPTTNANISAPGTLQLSFFANSVSQLNGTGNVNIFSTTLSVGTGNASSTFSGIIGDDVANPGNLTKIGTGTLTLSGANTYHGVTTLNAGVLRLSGVERLADASDVVINAGQFITQSETVDRVTLNGGELRGHLVGVGSIGAGTYNLNSGFCDAILSGPGGVIKGTAGLVTLNGNHAQGFTRVDAGTLLISSAASLGPSTAGVVLNGGTLSLAASMTINQPLSSFSPSTIDCFGDVLITNFSPFNSASLTKTGAGRLTLSGSPNSFGPLAVTAGEVRFAPEIAYPLIGGSIAAPATLTVDGSIVNLLGPLSNAGRLQLLPGARVIGNTLSNSGILAGSGTIASAFTNTSAGSVRIGEDDAILFSSTGSLANAGLIEVIGGSAEFNGAVSNAISTGLIFARDAALRFNAGLTNSGAVALSFGVSDIFGDINNSAAGVITVSGASDATFVDDVINNGTLRTSAGSAAVFLGALSGSGSFPGTGTVFMEGDLRPGNSPGRMTFGGDLVIGTFAGMQVEIAGATPNTYDTIDVAHSVVLDGTLDVAFVNGFRPSGCDSLTIIRANAVVGSFHTVNLPNNAALVYHPDRVELLLSGCPADLDDGSSTGTPDCGVTVDDLLYFIDGYTLGLLRADLDDGSATGTPDGGVTIDDLLYYLDRYTGGC